MYIIKLIKKNSKYLKCFVGLLITILSSFLILNKFDLDKITSTLKLINIYWLLFSCLFIVICMIIKSLRWQLLLHPIAKFKLKDTFIAFSIGNMFNMILPLRSGDISRAFFLVKNKNLSKISIFCTIVYEHIADLSTLLILFCIALLFYNYPMPKLLELFAFTLLICMIISISLLVIFKKYVSNIIKKLENKLKKYSYNFFFKALHTILNKILLSLPLSYSYKNLIKIIIYTLLIWIINGIHLYFLFFSFNSPYINHLGIGEISAIMVASGITAAIPSAPSYIGTLHLAIILTLKSTLIPTELIVAYTILIHAVGTSIPIIIGIPSLINNVFFTFKQTVPITENN